MRIYLDTCCLSRLDDVSTQTRIQHEAKAVRTILNNCLSGQWIWIGSEVLLYEVGNTRDHSIRLKTESKLNDVQQVVLLKMQEITRAKHLESLGLSL